MKPDRGGGGDDGLGNLNTKENISIPCPWPKIKRETTYPHLRFMSLIHYHTSVIIYKAFEVNMIAGYCSSKVYCDIALYCVVLNSIVFYCNS